ncbi:MAG: hypothetical protein ACRDVG_12325, partial [Jatrophihabitantaceae bacterium]
ADRSGRNRLDQDGAAQRERSRGISVHTRPDGSGTLTAEVTSQWLELPPPAAPAPATAFRRGSGLRDLDAVGGHN